MTPNQSSVGSAKSIRHNELVVTGHVIDQYIVRHPECPEPPTGDQELREFQRGIGRTIAGLVRKAVYLRDHGECKLYYLERMIYVVKVFPHYKKVITCYPRILD